MAIGSIAAQGMTATAVSQRVTANNIANVNTEGFKASRTDLETGPDGQGVRVSDIRETTTPGPLVSSANPQNQGYVEGSNTDLATEAVNMIQNQTSYSAGAALIRTGDEMTGTLLNMIA